MGIAPDGASGAGLPGWKGQSDNKKGENGGGKSDAVGGQRITGETQVIALARARAQSQGVHGRLAER
jgi:hypothetical protein